MRPSAVSLLLCGSSGGGSRGKLRNPWGSARAEAGGAREAPSARGTLTSPLHAGLTTCAPVVSLGLALGIWECIRGLRAAGGTDREIQSAWKSARTLPRTASPTCAAWTTEARRPQRSQGHAMAVTAAARHPSS